MRLQRLHEPLVLLVRPALAGLGDGVRLALEQEPLLLRGRARRYTAVVVAVLFLVGARVGVVIVARGKRLRLRRLRRLVGARRCGDRRRGSHDGLACVVAGLHRGEVGVFACVCLACLSREEEEEEEDEKKEEVFFRLRWRVGMGSFRRWMEQTPPPPSSSSLLLFFKVSNPCPRVRAALLRATPPPAQARKRP